MISTMTLSHLNELATVCPVAPAGATAPVDELTGNLLWFLVVAFGVSMAVFILLIVVGRMANSPRLVGAGAAGIGITLLAAIGYLVLPGLVGGILGDGCL